MSDIVPSEVLEPLKFALARAFAVSGRVVFPDGEPVREAIVWADAYSPRQGDSVNSRGVRSVKTQVDGTFRIGGLHCGKGYFFTAFADGFSPSSVEDIDLSSGEAVPSIEIRLQRPGAVEGRVLDPTGLSVSGADVKLSFVEPLRNTRFGVRVPFPPEFELETDGQGRFQADTLDPGHYEIAVEAPGLELRESPIVEVLEGVVASFEVTMAQEGKPVAILGRVVDELGAPVAGAKVGVSDQDSDTSTDSDGRFQIDGVVLDSAHVYAWKAGYAETGCYVTESTDQLLLRLPRSGVARVRVRGPDGQALLAVTILAWPSDGGDRVDLRDVDTDELSADGPEVLAKELAAGTYVLEAHSDGFLPGKSPPVIVRPSALTELIEIQLTRGAAVRGYAVLEDGVTPIEGVTVSAVPVDAAELDPSRQPPGDQTNEDGSFEISGVPEGSVRLEVEHGILAQLTFPILQIGAASVVTTNIILGEGGSFRGRITGLAAAGYPLRATPIRPDGTLEVWKQVDVGNSGLFTIQGLTPGVGVVQVHRESGHLPEVKLELPVTILAGERTEDHVELPPRVRLEGLCTLRGRRLSRASILLSQDDRLRKLHYSIQGWAKADGTFALDVLPGLAGTIEVELDEAGARKLRQPFDPPIVGQRLELELEPGRQRP